VFSSHKCILVKNIRGRRKPSKTTIRLKKYRR